MIKHSTVSKKASLYIQDTLQKLASEHEIEILLAIESGSRAWGFPSQNSDYDVRFIYQRRIKEYLTLQTPRDVIETPLIHDTFLKVPLDLNGWDLKKSLLLAARSNPVLLEWLHSPIQYLINPEAVALLKHYVIDCADTQAIQYHYLKLVRNAWTQINDSGPTLHVKLYCYAIRPGLMLEWTRQFTSSPPMDLYHLCAGLKLEQKLMDEIEGIILNKATTDEADFISRIAVIDEFIQSILQMNVQRPERESMIQDNINKGNNVFRQDFLKI